LTFIKLASVYFSYYEMRASRRSLLTEPFVYAIFRSMITLERKITVPADRRVIFDLPETVPEGKTSVVLVFPAQKNQTVDDDGDADDEMDATAFIDRNPAYREHILQAIDDARHGRNLVSVPADMFQTVKAVLKTG
jgi:hypothetical protein